LIEESKDLSSNKLTIKVKGISIVVMNIIAIKPEAIIPITIPMIIAPRRFDIDSYRETLMICLFGSPTAL
jgi:hypothetical protein